MGFPFVYSKIIDTFALVNNQLHYNSFMKKLFALIAAMIALSFVSCSKENKSQDAYASNDKVDSILDLTDQGDEDYADLDGETEELSDDLDDLDNDLDDESSSTLDELKRQSKEAAELIKKSADAAQKVGKQEMDKVLKQTDKLLKEAEKAQKESSR